MKVFILVSLLSFSLGARAKTILFLGDSLTEGYQINKEEAYPALVEKDLKHKKGNIKVINGGVSGATSASGSKRLDWYLKSKPNILVLALGANDGLRGQDVGALEKNLSVIIEKAQAQGIKVILAGMKMPTNMGATYQINFEKVFPRVAKKYNLKFIPFLLEGVATIRKYNLPDGIHPNSKGHEIMAQTVLKVLESEL